MNKDLLKKDRNVLVRVLESYGAKESNKGNWDCPGRHKDGRGDLSVKNVDGNWVCACHCGLKGDVFKVVEIMDNINDFKAQYKRVCEVNNIDMDNIEDRVQKAVDVPPLAPKEELKVDFTGIINSLDKSNIKYFLDRGLSIDTINKYGLFVLTGGLAKIGSELNIREKIDLKMNNSFWAVYDALIPIRIGGKIVNVMGRATDINKVKPIKGKTNKVMNCKGLKARFLNEEYTTVKKGELIFVCEGWADSLSFEELGYNSIAINSTANIEKFRKLIHASNTKNKYVVVADNDKAGEEMRTNFKHKLNKADCGCFEFVVDKKYKDINEWLIGDREGLKKAIEDNIINYSSKQEYIKNSKGNPYNNYDNFCRCLNNNNIEVKHNLLKHKNEIKGNNIGNDYDNNITEIKILLENDCMNFGKDVRYDYIHHVAVRNSYSPVIDYLTKVDKKYKCNGELTEYEKLFNSIKFSKSVTDKDKEMLKSALFKWLVNCVRLSFNEGDFNSEFMPIFKGKQGIGKTFWIRKLAERPGKEYFKDGVILEVHNKDQLIDITTYFIVEFGEFGGTTQKSGRDGMKAFITSPNDTYRAPFMRTPNTYPRRTSFFGTVNDDEFLRDETGNRRFVVFDIDKIDWDSKIDYDKFWAEMYFQFKNNLVEYNLTKEELIISENRNRRAMVRSEEQTILEDCLDLTSDQKTWEYITSLKLCSYINDNYKIKLSSRKIGTALKVLGIEQETKRIRGVKGRYYLLPALPGYSRFMKEPKTEEINNYNPSSNRK